jgi:hypothetical protein
MPIYEYVCANCRNKVEKITLKIVKDSTVPQEIKQKCTAKCAGMITRHRRCITAPAYVGLTPPATSKRVTTMAQMKKPTDPDWKKRVKKGINADGKKLPNLRKENRQQWNATVDSAFPDLVEKQKEVVGRAKAGEFKTFFDATKVAK